MTIQVTSSRVQYIGDGVTTTFAVDFRFFIAENLNVYFDNILQADTSYTVQNSGGESGSSVTFGVAPPDGVVVVIERALPLNQLLDLIEYDRFPAESVESGFDYLMLCIQQNFDALQRSFVAAPDMPADVDLTVPAPGAGEFLKYTGDGKALETADIKSIDQSLVSTATDQEITEGSETTERLISPAQVKLGVQSHETAPIDSVFNVQWVSVVDVLPSDLDPNTMYLVRE